MSDSVRPCAYVVSVEYADMLAVTLPRALANAFSRVTVITTITDNESQSVARRYGAAVYVTDAFYRSGAPFNKGLALAEAMAADSPDGWCAVIDADILFPAAPDWTALKRGCLHVPPRRLLYEVTPQCLALMLAHEEMWRSLSRVDEGIEFPGYCQVWHTEDAPAQIRPRYPTHWRHAGGCDSDFAWRWPVVCRSRLPWEVLHIGPLNKNWHGRVTAMLDGTVPAKANEREADHARDREIRMVTRDYSHEHVKKE